MSSFIAALIQSSSAPPMAVRSTEREREEREGFLLLEIWKRVNGDGGGKGNSVGEL